VKKLDIVKRVLAMLVLATVAGAALAAPAQAYNHYGYWNQSSSPLVKSGYGSTAKAYGKSKIFNGSDGTKLYNYAWNKFTDADNHRAYLTGVSQWNSGSCRNSGVGVTIYGVSVNSSTNCSATYFDGKKFDRANGLNHTNNTWTAMPTRTAAPTNGSDRGRAKVKLCIDIPFRTDPCTGDSISAFDTY
jgi:hypothetical protein